MTATKSGETKIGVVVPVRDEEKSITSLIEALLKQTRPPDEIVITDTGSKDATLRIVQDFIDRGAPIKLIGEPAAFPGRGRNVGVTHSECDWIAFTDAGNTPRFDWLASLAQKIEEDENVDVVYGTYEPVVDTFFKECAAIAYVPPSSKVDEGVARPCSIVSALMRRKVWAAAGGFPEHLRSAEDLLFIRKVEQANFRIVRAPAAVVRWEIQPNLWRTFKRFVTYARNNIRAGLWREWQAAIFLRYGLILALIAPAIFLGARWLALPLLFWLWLLVARAGRALRRNQDCFHAGHLRNLARLCWLIPIIATLDAAALLGSINWLLLDKLRPGGVKTENVPGR
jgi:glycosyltransferase involved in cell wall biosynthesis